MGEATCKRGFADHRVWHSTQSRSIVVDASALVDYLTLARMNRALDERLTGSGDFHAPYLIDIEVAPALQRLAVRGELGADRAADARLDLAALPLRRYPHVPLLERAWELRHIVSAYDAIARRRNARVPLDDRTVYLPLLEVGHKTVDRGDDDARATRIRTRNDKRIDASAGAWMSSAGASRT